MSIKEASKKAQNNFEVTISKEELAGLPPQKFIGEIIVIDDEPTADDALKELEEASIVGFDTETKPAFQKGQHNKVALLQLATEEKCFLFRISKMGLPASIKAFLENERHTKVGLSIKDDFHSLSKLGTFNPSGFIDLQEYVKKFHISDCSLTKIHSIVFGKRISKNQQLTNWEAQTLTEKQIEYAALDALACVKIYNRLNSGSFDPNISPYKKDICPENN